MLLDLPITPGWKTLFFSSFFLQSAKQVIIWFANRNVICCYLLQCFGFTSFPWGSLSRSYQQSVFASPGFIDIKKTNKVVHCKKKIGLFDKQKKTRADSLIFVTSLSREGLSWFTFFALIRIRITGCRWRAKVRKLGLKYLGLCWGTISIELDVNSATPARPQPSCQTIPWPIATLTSLPVKCKRTI